MDLTRNEEQIRRTVIKKRLGRESCRDYFWCMHSWFRSL